MPNENTAGLIAGTLQTAIHLRPVWNALQEDEARNFLSRWKQAITCNPATAVDAIVVDIASHPALRQAWDGLEPKMREHLIGTMRAIIDHT